MATILLGWELGGGLGHVRTLASLAEHLAQRGHRPVLALKDVAAAQIAPPPSSCTVTSAPAPHSSSPRGFRARSFADILAVRGYADPSLLIEQVRGWDRLLSDMDAKLVVADHAPTLLLAAHRRFPAVTIGSGFATPPSDGVDFPVFNNAATAVVPSDRLLGAINQVQRRLRRAALDRLPEFLDVSVKHINAIRELDPYRHVRKEATYSPTRVHAPSPRGDAEIDWFVYASAAYSGLTEMLAQFAERGWSCEAYVRGELPPLATPSMGKRVRFWSSPPPLADVLPRARAVVHHGGLSTAVEAAAIGRPQLLLPRHLEQEMTAAALNELGVGDFLMGRAAFDDVLRVSGQVLTNPRVAVAARDFASRLRSRNSSANTLEALAESCERLVN